MAELKEQVVIEDGLLGKMLTRPEYLKEFSFLREYAAAFKKRKGCGSCGGRARQHGVDFTEVKRTLAAMPREKLGKLMDMLRTRSVKFWYRDRSDKVVKFVVNRAQGG